MIPKEHQKYFEQMITTKIFADRDGLIYCCNFCANNFTIMKELLTHQQELHGLEHYYFKLDNYFIELHADLVYEE